MTTTQHLTKMQFDLADMKAKLKTLTTTGQREQARHVRDAIIRTEAEIREVEHTCETLTRARCVGGKRLIRFF